MSDNRLLEAREQFEAGALRTDVPEVSPLARRAGSKRTTNGGKADTVVVARNTHASTQTPPRLTRAAFLICEVAMPAVTLFDHRISRAWDELKHARRRGDVNKIIYWMSAVNTLLDRKLEEREAE